MHEFDIATISTSKLDESTNVPVIQATIPITDDNEDYEPFGDLDSYQALGVTSLPFPANSEGHAEGVILRDVGNQDAVVIGARDTRTTEVYGDIAEGDTVLHSVEPDAQAQVQCKANHQIALVTQDTDGNTMLQLLDGKNDKIQISAFGGIVEMSKENGIIFTEPSGKASIQMIDGTIILSADSVLLGGINSTVPVLITAQAGVPNVAGVFV